MMALGLNKVIHKVCLKKRPDDMSMTGSSPGDDLIICKPKYAKYIAPTHCNAANHKGEAFKIAAKPATAAHINTWSPAMTPNVALIPPRRPPKAVEVNKARFPGPGIAKNTITAPTNAG